MNPFDHNLDQNDLIAYHLGELSPQQKRALLPILQNNAVLAAESEAIAATLRAFPKHEPSLPLDAETLERYWLALRPSLVVHFPKPFAPHSLFHRWHLPAFAGVAVTVLALVASLHHQQHAHPSTVATIEAPASTAPPLTPSPSAPSSAALSPNLNLNASASRLSAINRAWPSPSAPMQTGNPRTPDNPQTSLTVPPPEPLTPQTPAQPTPAEPSPANTSVAPTEGAASMSSNTPPMPSSTQSNTARQSFKIHHPHPADFTLAMFGNLAATSTSTSTSGTGTSLVTESRMQSATPAVGALASFHQQISPRIGYRITTTYSRPDFGYGLATSTAGGVSSGGGSNVNTRIYELSGTYVVQGPHHRRLTTSVEAGASLLAFLSTDPYLPFPSKTDTALRAAAVVGVGSELALSKHLALHVEYRAQFYKPPAFYLPNTSSTPGNLTLSSNPIFGITYRFGTRGDD